MTIHQVLREFVDEDGVYRWWTYLQPEDVVTGREFVDGKGEVLVEIEHTVSAPQGFWSKPKVVRRAVLYAPEEIRYLRHEVAA